MNDAATKLRVRLQGRRDLRLEATFERRRQREAGEQACHQSKFGPGSIGFYLPEGSPMRILIQSILFVFAMSGAIAAETGQQPFDDPMFRRCLTWMLDGQKGVGLDHICLDDYEIPSPSVFLCARKAQTGFLSITDRDVCAVVFEEQVRKVRAGFVRCPVAGSLSEATTPAPRACSTD